MLKSFWKRFGLLGLIIISFGTFAQDAELGMEYMKAGDYEKAKTVFQKLAKNKETAKVIHKPYLQTLIKLKEFEEAEKFVKKQIKNSDGNAKYITDYARLLEIADKKEEAQKQYAIAMDKVKSDDGAMMELVNELDRKSTRLNSSHSTLSRMPSSA